MVVEVWVKPSCALETGDEGSRRAGAAVGELSSPSRASSVGFDAGAGVGCASKQHASRGGGEAAGRELRLDHAALVVLVPLAAVLADSTLELDVTRRELGRLLVERRAGRFICCRCSLRFLR